MCGCCWPWVCVQVAVARLCTNNWHTMWCSSRKACSQTSRLRPHNGWGIALVSAVICLVECYLSTVECDTGGAFLCATPTAPIFLGTKCVMHVGRAWQLHLQVCKLEQNLTHWIWCAASESGVRTYQAYSRYQHKLLMSVRWVVQEPEQQQKPSKDGTPPNDLMR